MPDWRVEQLRLTVFSAQNLRQPVPNWWREIAGADPSMQTVQQGIVVQHVGVIRNGYCQLRLDIKPGRIDWLMMPNVDPNEMPTSFPSFDSYTGAIGVFRELILPWAGRLTDVRRVAIGSVQTFAVDSKEAGYRALAPLLPAVQLDPLRSSDLVYQINRHAVSPSAVEGLHINRLSHWSVVRFKLIAFQVTGGGPPVAVNDAVPDANAVRLQLDVNTDAERSEFLPNTAIVPIVEELIRFSDEIADRGDPR